MTTKTEPLTHATWCTGERVERTEHPDVTAVHCIDCGAHAAVQQDGTVRPPVVVTGALSGAGRGDMDIEMRRATWKDVSER